MCYTWSPAYANYFLIETAFTHRKFVFPPLEKNGQAHVAIATPTTIETTPLRQK